MDLREKAKRSTASKIEQAATLYYLKGLRAIQRTIFKFPYIETHLVQK